MRVLKAQLDLAARSVRTTRVTSPLWALALAILCSDRFGMLRSSPSGRDAFLAACGDGGDRSGGGDDRGLSERDRPAIPMADLGAWHRRHCFMQLVVSAAWGTMPWLLWERGNAVNHLFLACCAIAVVSALVLARGSNMAMFVCALVPISLMTTARFATGDSTLDYVIAIASPLFGLQMWWTGRPLVIQMQRGCAAALPGRGSGARAGRDARRGAEETLRGGNRQCLQDRLPRQYEPRIAHAPERHSGFLRNHRPGMFRPGRQSSATRIMPATFIPRARICCR